MGSEPMELAKNWDAKNASKILPAFAEIKYDGVPLTFKKVNGNVVAYTRQMEVCNSVPHLNKVIGFLLNADNASVTGECLIPGQPFKVSSGVLRRLESTEESARMICIIFDANLTGNAKDTYYTRMNQLDLAFAPIEVAWKLTYKQHPQVWPVKRMTVYTVEDVENVWNTIKAQVKNPEGMCLHQMTKPWSPGKRIFYRYKPQPTIDLLVLSFEEAISEAGEGLGMLGRVNVMLRRRQPDGTVLSREIGIGPGKLTHYERKAHWKEACHRLGYTDLINLPTGQATVRAPDQMFAEIKYMPDPSYDALRQPTIQQFRWDKTEGDILE